MGRLGILFADEWELIRGRRGEWLGDWSLIVLIFEGSIFQ
jgi:hypothetical protein